MITMNSPVEVNPKILTIFGSSKVGKSTACAKLPNSLLIDLEGGSHYLDCPKVDVLKESIKNSEPRYIVLKRLAGMLTKKSTEKTFEYLVFDTLSGLETIAEELALFLYKNSEVGKNYTGNDILELPMGAGYMWLRKAFAMIIDKFIGLSPYIILVAHLKTASIVKDGKELSIQDINLSGKLKYMVSAMSDAIGILSRKDNKTIISFKSNTDEVLAGARPEHLRGKEFVLTELTPKGIQAYWDKIYIKKGDK